MRVYISPNCDHMMANALASFSTAYLVKKPIRDTNSNASNSCDYRIYRHSSNLPSYTIAQSSAGAKPSSPTPLQRLLSLTRATGHVFPTIT